jgi:hypothetical protein
MHKAVENKNLFVCLFVVLGMELRASYVLVKCSTPELHPQATKTLFLN